MGSIRVYYSANLYSANCWCTRWDESDWDVTVETFLTSGQRNDLFSHVTPGAVTELYSILGLPHFIDSTYSSGNTLMIEPIDGYGISSLRNSRVIAVKNISDSFLTPNLFTCKIEGKRIDIE